MGFTANKLVSKLNQIIELYVLFISLPTNATCMHAGSIVYENFVLDSFSRQIRLSSCATVRVKDDTCPWTMNCNRGPVYNPGISAMGKRPGSPDSGSRYCNP